MRATLQQRTKKDMQQPNKTPIRHPWKRLFRSRKSIAVDITVSGRRYFWRRYVERLNTEGSERGEIVVSGGVVVESRTFVLDGLYRLALRITNVYM
jgi:hypothetical protein